MRSTSMHGIRRRTTIAMGLRLATGLAICSGLGERVALAADKVAKSAVQYKDVGGSPGKDCDDCVQFIPGKNPAANGTCKIVEGDISPHGHCIAFTPRPKK